MFLISTCAQGIYNIFEEDYSYLCSQGHKPIWSEEPFASAASYEWVQWAFKPPEAAVASLVGLGNFRLVVCILAWSECFILLFIYIFLGKKKYGY